MLRKPHTTVGVSAVALILISLLWLRLDVDTLNSRLAEKMDHYADSTIQAENTSLTFMHGIGLRLNQVTLDHPDFQLQAKHINISLRLLPLLLGNIEVDTLDMHDALFKLKSDALALNATSISTLPVERIQLIRSRIEAADGTSLLNNIQLELRGIGTEHETLWEFNAQHDKQAVSGHGRILFQHGQIESGFGKIKLANMPVKKLHSLAPASLMHWIEGEGNKLSGSVTIDISKHQRWALFGEMMLENRESRLAVKLRGKLSHLTDGRLVWKDSFIHLDEKAVIAIVGSCEKNSCSTTLHAQNIELARWHPFIPQGVTFHRKISATTQLNASLKWNEKTWQGNAALKLEEASFQHGDQVIALPALYLDIHELSGGTKTWTANANINSPKVGGTIQVKSNQEANGDKNLEIETHESHSKLWQPLSNLLLSSLGLKPALQATGQIQGSLHFHQHGKVKTVELDIDATATEINYQAWLKKVPDVAARCQANIKLIENKPYALKMNNCQLDQSHMTSLSWSQKKGRQSLAADKLSLNFDSLKKQSILLPDHLKGLIGTIQGSGSSSWKESEHWSKRMHGQWQLHKLGTDKWQANGDVRIEKGVLRASPLMIDGIYGKAQLKGSYNIARKRGNIDIISGSLDWSKLHTLPASAHQISLRGKIKQADITLLNNHWHDLRSNYTLSQGTLELQQLQSSFAGGTLSSNKIMLSPTPDGLSIRGDLRGKKIQLGQLQDLSAWMQADVNGLLQANIILSGRINHPGMNSDWQKTWRRSNGDILIYSGSWQQHKKAKSLTERLGFKAAPILNSYAFKKLEFRFRMFENRTDISSLKLISHERSYQGNVSISPEMYMSGYMLHKASQNSYAIDSQLPQINWKTE